MANRYGGLIPCPVCGGVLRYGCWPTLEGDRLTPPTADCGQRHAATTEPGEWERLRLEALARHYEEFMADPGNLAARP